MSSFFQRSPLMSIPKKKKKKCLHNSHPSFHTPSALAKASSHMKARVGNLRKILTIEVSNSRIKHGLAIYSPQKKIL